MALTIVGCGPGSPDCLTPEARQAVQAADVLVGARRLLEMFPTAGRERIPVGSDIPWVLERIAERLPAPVAVLVSGDPGFCSLARPVLARFGREGCRVIPAVSSVQVAFARIGLDWFDARFVNAHHRIPELDASTLGEVSKLAILAGRPQALAWIADLGRQLGGDRRIFVCEDLTLPEERVREVRLAQLADLETSSRTVVLVVGRECLP
ncbi:MAG: precorrin-6y C5,15-methyltransferase (decarboxylating) subunit CbiE [Armatimonadetes bacterium]|nr:precorrin-6y C5,15-methyltransferase (decarboxylating) subunit CbiE [Armatimonadota bacterium]